MRKFKFGITYWLAALLVVFVAGCGEETVVVPSVVSTVPVNGATNVSVNTPISATFSMAMNPATLTSATFTVAGPDGAVAGAVAYSGDTATFTPSALSPTQLATRPPSPQVRLTWAALPFLPTMFGHLRRFCRLPRSFRPFQRMVR